MNKEFMELSIEGVAFDGLRADFDKIIKRTIANMQRRESSKADITVKLTINLEDVSVPDDYFGNGADELLAPEPYSVMYIYWIFMKIDFANGEFDRFNNDAMLFNTAWLAFSNHVNRTHAPKKRAKIENV